MKSKIRLVLKRLTDVLLSLIGLSLLAVPFALIAVVIKFDSRGPIFFQQVRIGRGGPPFRVWKFRTMTVMQISPAGPDLLSRDDARITHIGRFLRGLGLDELPQLVNVLSGEMSLVGPRPTLAYQVCEYTDFHQRRLEVKPGITSLAVVSGRNALSWEERIKLDIWYIDHWSLRLDLRILIQTLWKVLVTREGLYGQDGVNDMFIGKAAEPNDASHKGD